MNLIIKAAEFAKHAHEGQVRKYTGRPYVEHPMRVAGEVSMIDGATEQMVAAAWMHDVIEDCAPELRGAMKLLFPQSVCNLVQELTNPSKDHPELKRAERKAMDRNHLASVSDEAKIIKLVDRIDNLREMTGAEPDFLLLYSRESRMLADALRTDKAPFPTLTNRIYRVTAPYMKATA
jgi:(p)ppGpp synthase/HD superfamily hydrolase